MFLLSVLIFCVSSAIFAILSAVLPTFATTANMTRLGFEGRSVWAHCAALRNREAMA